MRYEGSQIGLYKGAVGKKIWQKQVECLGTVTIAVFDHPNDIGGAILGVDRAGTGFTYFEYPGLNGSNKAVKEAKKLVKIYSGEL